MENYVARYFVDFDAIVRRSGADVLVVQSLLEAGAAPGVIYARQSDGQWWSALGACVGREPEKPTTIHTPWYSPASVWWLRRALLKMSSGSTAEAAALHNEKTFVEGFVRSLADTDDAALAYPSAFEGDEVNMSEAQRVGAAEWAAWVQGAYGVCLRRFSARSCVEKEALRARIVAAGEGSPQHQMSDEALFEKVEQLESLLMPFAPYERQDGSPGRAIDAPLARMKLGVEEPYQS